MQEAINQVINPLVLSKLAHNGELIRKAEKYLNDALDGRTNTAIWIENPDGTTIILEHGFKIHDVEIELI